MSQFTSFVAVEETTVTKGGEAVRVEVPLEMPEGVSYEGIYGERAAMDASMPGGRAYSKMMPSVSRPRLESFASENMPVVSAIPQTPPRRPVQPPKPTPLPEPISRFSPEIEQMLTDYGSGSLSGDAAIIKIRVEVDSWSDALNTWLKNVDRVVFRSERSGILVVEVHLKEIAALRSMEGIRRVSREQ